MNPHSHPLHLKAMGCARNHKRAESDLIEVLLELDASELFRQFDCSSLRSYAIKILRLSEPVSDALLAVARRQMQDPHVV